MDELTNAPKGGHSYSQTRPCGAHTILVAPTGRGATRTHCVLLGTRIFAAPGTVTAARQARVVGMVSHGSGRLSGFYGRS